MRILVAMSGGVDSSVAAKLLTDAGNDCVGCTMKLYQNEDAGVPRSHTCCSFDDVADARSVAFGLGMPYYVFNFSDGFREKVIGRFAESYLRGETPNPCIDCNRYMKFEKLFERADILGCGHIAIGHYARIERGADGLYTLRRALDPSKDQSYVLYTMTQAQLARTLFPLGSLRKDEVREIAARSGLPTASKPDSQDICFAPDGDYARAVERYAGRRAEPGAFVSPDGEILGTHRGIIHYTVGQRRGLGLSFAERRYVCGIDPVRNTVTLGREEDLLCREVETGAFHWISGRAPDAPFACTARLRYRQPEQPVRVFPRPDGTALLRFDRPLRAAAPGQAAVLYQGDVVLGGGVIRRCGASLC